MRDVKVKAGEVIRLQNVMITDKLFLGRLLYSLKDTVWDRFKFLFTGKSKLEYFYLFADSVDVIGSFKKKEAKKNGKKISNNTEN